MATNFFFSSARLKYPFGLQVEPNLRGASKRAGAARKRRGPALSATRAKKSTNIFPIFTLRPLPPLRPPLAATVHCRR
jgi:hypothetical protein